MTSRHFKQFRILLILILWSAILPAQEEIRVRDVLPYMTGDSLKCSYRISDLIQGAVRQTLVSGLPVLIEEQCRLVDEKQHNTSTVINKFRITYDIWEDVIHLDGAFFSKTFPSPDSLNKWWAPRRDIFLTATSSLPNASRAYIFIRLRVILLSRSQSERLKDWILNSQETEENLPTQDRDTGFTLNLNRLLSLFFRKDDITKEITINGKSEWFYPNTLPRR